MKAIAKTVHENLTPEQRVRAAVAAVARNDEAEVKKLRETCPKQTYRMTDSAFSERMESLMLLSLAVECDQRGRALDYLRENYRAKTIDSKDSKSLIKSFDLTDEILRDIASIDAAWRQAVERLGIAPDDMAKAGASRHHVTEILVNRARDQYDPKPELVSEALQAMEEQLGSGA